MKEITIEVGGRTVVLAVKGPSTRPLTTAEEKAFFLAVNALCQELGVSLDPLPVEAPTCGAKVCG